MRRYEDIASTLARQIAAGVLRPGERLPSIREAQRTFRASAGTVRLAYEQLVDRGDIQARARSGYYVAVHRARPLMPRASAPSLRPRAPTIPDTLPRVLAALRAGQPCFGAEYLHAALVPTKALTHALCAGARSLVAEAAVADLALGNPSFRREVARHYLRRGASVDVEEVIVTSGAVEALSLSLGILTCPGDVVAIECPCAYGVLDALRARGLQVLQLPTAPHEGIDLDALADAVRKGRVRTCCLSPTFQDPTGASLTDEAKARLVALLARHEVPLIEYDPYGELALATTAPRPMKAHDRAGLVLSCSSFCASVAPGFRVGWVCAGRYAEEMRWASAPRLPAASLPAQAALAMYLPRGGYRGHMRQVRRELRASRDAMTRGIQKDFPPGTRATCPEGGYFLWVQLPRGMSAMSVFDRALEAGITLLPGPLFAADGRFCDCMRLSYGMPWSRTAEAALATLGRIVRRQLPPSR